MSNSTHHLSVQGMSCQHCVKAITQAIQAQDPSAVVQVDLASGQVTVDTSLPRSTLTALIEDEGYGVTP